VATANATAIKGAADGGFARDAVTVVVSGALASVVALVGLSIIKPESVGGCDERV
jgi:hypothetical protein